MTVTEPRPKTRAGAPTPPHRQPRVLSFSQRLSKWDLKVSPYLYISPFFITFAVVGLFPIIYTAIISFMDWDLIRGSGTFVGFDQYIWILSQPHFWTALRNTFSIFLLSTIPQIILAIFIASVLDRNLRAKTFWRMSVLVPFVVAPVAVGLIFNAIFADQSGLANAWLQAFGLSAIPWHVDPFWSHVAIATMVNYRWTGYNALILLAAMQAVNRDYYEAATVDGAGPIRQFFSITLPSLKPTLIFVIITATIGGLQIFDEPRVFDQFGRGGAAQQWLTITLYLYQIGWGQWNFGRAAAMAWILFIIILGIGLLNLLITRTLVRDEGLRSEISKRQAKELARAAKKDVEAKR
ncbi:MAG: ABC transporter permease [Microbacterium sp. SCN 70-18]|uniref:Sugar ABC transporter permease n=1 Tax=Microbacterium aurantiacum TaxID=162393 RepID=A0AAJ2HEJ7_9MICO|nr:sugar ABC transporter permease [Microbacterium aurantiacum]MBN9200317.1 sugar ABC transporter permease [Microbacterium chocolatum]MDS0244696.1 sugar ABC transporter permease [Microbacterium aurantiacum]ODT11303.1 MAG: ABC transporter permease [Microbacterium sp. SCN 70-18]